MNRKSISVSGSILLFIVLINVILIREAYTGSQIVYWFLPFTLGLLFLAISNVRQKGHAILRNFPIIGYLRYFFEWMRPEIRQYFFESDLDGKPFNRRQRSLVYQRAKNVKQTVAFGMQANPNAPGFEWAAHSVYPSTL